MYSVRVENFVEAGLVSIESAFNEHTKVADATSDRAKSLTGGGNSFANLLQATSSTSDAPHLKVPLISCHHCKLVNYNAANCFPFSSTPLRIVIMEMHARSSVRAIRTQLRSAPDGRRHTELGRPSQTVHATSGPNRVC